MDPHTMQADAERARSMARALASLDPPGAAGLSLLIIGLNIAALLAMIAAIASIRALLRGRSSGGPSPGPRDILIGSVGLGLGFGAAECVCGALAYLFLLMTGEAAWSLRALGVLGVV